MRTKAARIVSVLLMLLTLASIVAVPASAVSISPYKGYNYDSYGEATAAPLGYLPDKTIDYNAMGLDTKFNAPADMFVYNDEQIWVADTGNNRIVALDKNYRYITQFSKFTAADGTEYPLTKPQCVYVKYNKELAKQEIFVCCNVISKNDKGKEFKDGYVVSADIEGNVIKVFKNPSDSVTSINDFQPTGVVVDDSNYVYVHAYGVLDGLIVYDYYTGDFITYYGANKVVLTVKLAVQQIWKKIFSRSASASMIQAVPTEMSNIFVDKEGFIYTTTETETVDKDLRVRKLNAVGANTLQGDENAIVDVVFGEREEGSKYSAGATITVDTRMTDIHVDDNEMMACMDAERARVYIYDKTCTLMTVFGYKSSGSVKEGATANPVAVSKLGEKYLLLDADRGTLVSYRPTDYMKMLIQANELYNDGFYVKGEPYWRKVLKYDSNFSRGYAAIGKSLLEKEKYQDALYWLKIGQDRTSYSMALAEYRKEFLRANYWWCIPVAVIAVVAFVMLIKFIQKCLGIKKKAKHIKFN